MYIDNMLKSDAHIFGGMQRDMSVSKQQPEFLWEAHNVRLTPRDGETMLSITNEKGTKRITSGTGTFAGTYLGYCVMNNYLVVFTVDGEDCYIYRVDKSYNYKVDILYKGRLQFDPGHPIETLGVYENELVQKVYWVDGANQPRLINIVKELLDGSTVEAVRQKYNDSSFDFVRDLSLSETVRVRRMAAAGGQFQSGVIQYALTYFDKYGQESNIAYVTPLYPISHANRGGSPEEKVDVSFRITVDSLDTNFDYARLYSLYRSSLNGKVVAKKLTDIPITDDTTVTGGTSNQTFYWRTNQTVLITGKTKAGAEYNDRYIFAFTGYVEDISGQGFPSGRYWHFKKSDWQHFEIHLGNQILTWGGNTDFYISYNTKIDGPGDGNQRLIHGGLGTGNWFRIGTTATYGTAITGASFIDNGTQGEIVDATSLLYVGGETVTASALNQKDGTLFLGNIQILRPPVSALDQIKITGNNTTGPTSGVAENSTREVYLSSVDNSNYYDYKSLFTATDSSGFAVCPAGFKNGERYRFGIQLQYKSGKWSDPIWLKDVDIEGTPKLERRSNKNVLTIPTYKITVNLQNVPEGYKRVRGVAVFPTMSERTVIAQGIVAPTVFNLASRVNGIPYAQSSWFFRMTPPTYQAISDTVNAGSDAETGAILEYRDGYLLPSRGDRGAEIQGLPEYAVGKYVGTNQSSNTAISFPQVEDDRNQDSTTWGEATSLFAVDRSIVTFHSPDVEFDDAIDALDFSGISTKYVGNVLFTANMGDISLQTSSPTIHPDGAGFVHRSMKHYNANGTAKTLAAGLFYSDYLVDDADSKYRWYNPQRRHFLFMVYPWQKSGSVNNDAVRPADKGTRSAVLSQKKISNLRFASSVTWGTTTTVESDTMELFSSDQVSILKLGGDKSYYGNVDTMLSPIGSYSVVFDNGDAHDAYGSSTTDPKFTRDKNRLLHFTRRGTDDYRGIMWHRKNTGEKYSGVSHWSDVGDDSGTLATSREGIRMKYKSTKHVVISLKSVLTSSNAGLPMVELRRARTTTLSDDTIFGGNTDEAKRANTWIPVGEPVAISRTGDTVVNFDYGDTWYQRYDCLKTYPFTLEDENSITEIASFLVETRVNIDGRYDRNRGQASNLVTTPINFNLMNMVYSQPNNFFSYRILDSDYYKLDNFQSSITWSLNKESAAVVDSWAKVTLANILDFDGNMGAVTALVTSNDNIYCFQESGVSQVLFNSRVQIPTSDGVPVEISNNYKVDGNRYLSDHVGLRNKWALAKANGGLYFVDSTGNTLYHLGSGLTDVSGTHNFSYWFDTVDTATPWTPQDYSLKVFYDRNKNDVYITSFETSLAFSEVLGQFISFMDYQNTPAMFNIGSDFYAIRDGELWQLFKGDYNSFFGELKPFSIEFVSNAESVVDKTYTNLEMRADFYRDEYSDNTLSAQDVLQHRMLFDYIQASNEYQDTGEVSLTFKNAKPSNLKKKFRIWRIDIPRDKDRKLDRIRNTWAHIKLGVNKTDSLKWNTRMELHDLAVQYFS